MKSLAELEQIRKQTLERINLRKEDKADLTRIVVGMATCGIAAGARPVMHAFMDEVNKRQLQHVTISQTGCIGMCRLEPMVDVITPDGTRSPMCMSNRRWCRASSPSTSSTAGRWKNTPSALRKTNN